jgi:HPt (histidine-containing phosphotransfer) domain-containing protein
MPGDETTRAHPEGDLRVLDPAAVSALYELFGEDREALADLIDSFVEEAPERLAELHSGADVNDTELVGRAAHTLKSNGSTFGAHELAALCRRLETSARADELAGSAELIDRIEAEWALVERELATLRNGP